MRLLKVQTQGQQSLCYTLCMSYTSYLDQIHTEPNRFLSAMDAKDWKEIRLSLRAALHDRH